MLCITRKISTPQKKASIHLKYVNILWNISCCYRNNSKDLKTELKQILQAIN